MEASKFMKRKENISESEEEGEIRLSENEAQSLKANNDPPNSDPNESLDGTLEFSCSESDQENDSLSLFRGRVNLSAKSTRFCRNFVLFGKCLQVKGCRYVQRFSRLLFTYSHF